LAALERAGTALLAFAVLYPYVAIAIKAADWALEVPEAKVHSAAHGALSVAPLGISQMVRLTVKLELDLKAVAQAIALIIAIWPM
jgi:hypothetical protein